LSTRNYHFQFTNLYRFGFIKGHNYLTSDNINELNELIFSPSNDIISKYENELSNFTKSGFIKTFAAGRMAFYLLLQSLDIRSNDEIILVGFTCSVMVNAILRVGAKPVYCDIDINTFGLDPIDLIKKISSKTKVIVAQHSFGIPCEIEEICRIGKNFGIYVIEDCSLTLSSLFKDRSVGSFGDGAIFSTDHTKPLNTLIGGWLSVRSSNQFDKINELTKKTKTLVIEHQKRLLNQIIYESIVTNPHFNLKSFVLKTKKYSLSKLGLKRNLVFLLDDFDLPSNKTKSNYAYPSLLPTFLARLGLHELQRWSVEMFRRKEILSGYIKILNTYNFDNYIPKCYSNKDYNIVPLRFIMNDSIFFDYKLLNKYFKTEWFWFKKPIIGSSLNLNSLYYHHGSCSNSEKICNSIINFPCVINEEFNEILFELFRKTLILK